MLTLIIKKIKTKNINEKKIVFRTYGVGYEPTLNKRKRVYEECKLLYGHVFN